MTFIRRLQLEIPILWVLFWCPVLWDPTLMVFDAMDEKLFHGPTIQGFAAQLPWPNLQDYASATTPLYHLVFAPLSWLTEHHLPTLRAANLLLSGACLWLVVRCITLWANPKLGALGGLIVGMSPYFIGPAIRLSTDNAALLSVFATLLATHPTTARSPWRASLWSTAAVWTRQIHVWLLAPILLAGLSAPKRRSTWLLTALLPIVALAPLAATWGGLTPPSFARGHETSLNVDVLVMSLGILGAYSVFFSPWVIRTLRRKEAKLWVPGIAALGLALLAQHSMPWQDDPTRWGGALWSASARVPELLAIPVTFWATVPLGALTLLAFATHHDRKTARFLSLSTAVFIAANMLSARAYQKYTDPMLLFMLVTFLTAQPRIHRISWLLPGLLVLGLGTVSIFRFLV